MFYLIWIDETGYPGLLYGPMEYDECQKLMKEEIEKMNNEISEENTENEEEDSENEECFIYNEDSDCCVSDFSGSGWYILQSETNR